MSSRIGSALRQTPVVPVIALLFCAAIVVYAALHGSGTSSSTPTQTLPPQPTNSIGPYIIFTSPANNSTVSNPVTVSMAIGGGLAFQKEGETPQQNQGHLWVVVDGELPVAGITLKADATHIDLADGGHTTALPSLTEGDHVVTAIWTDSQNKVSSPATSVTIDITVGPPSS